MKVFTVIRYVSFVSCQERQKPVNVFGDIWYVVVRVEIELDDTFISEFNHSDTHSVFTNVQFADDALGEVLDSIPVPFVVFVDTS